MDDNRIETALTYAGAIPFVLCAILPFAGIESLGRIGSVDYVARVYGLAILSFVAGTHWGTYLFNRLRSPANLFVTSNVVVVAAWSAFLLTGPALTLFVLVLSFLYLLLIDFNLYRAGLSTAPYFSMRLNATLIVCISLTLNVIQLFV